MGVDARMVLRTKMHLDEEQIRDLSYDLCEAFGADKFFIDPRKNYPGNYRSGLAVDVLDPDDEENFYFDFPFEPDDQLIELHLWGRYWGEGYERGDFPLYSAISTWLSLRFPEATIFYGGDCDDKLEDFTPGSVLHDRLWRHFADVGNNPYYGSWGDRKYTCPNCNKETRNHGGGGGRSFHHCPGCGERSVVGPDGSSVTEDGTVGDSTFDLARRYDAGERGYVKRQ